MPASSGLRRSRSGRPALATASHTARSLVRAPARPTSARPAATATALTAPALVALIQAKSSVSSSSRRSSTPQVKAPCAPPPSSARLRRCCRTEDAPRELRPSSRITGAAHHGSRCTGQHNRHAVDRGIAGIDAIDGGKVLNRQHILRRAGGHHAARVHQHDPVTEARGERQVVQRDDHRAPLGREPGEVLEQRQLVRRVETGRRLVGEQRGGLLRQRARHQHARALAARHLEHRARREMRHVHGRERCRRWRARRPRSRPRPAAGAAGDRARPRRAPSAPSARCAPAAGRRASARAAAGPNRDSGRPSAADRARDRREQARERAQQGGLAGAVGADDGRHLGGLGGEIDAAQNMARP